MTHATINKKIVPAIHAFFCTFLPGIEAKKLVDARHKAGHDGLGFIVDCAN